MRLAGGLLLDTCAWLWWVEGTLDRQVAEQLVQAGLGPGILVSAVSAWEIGLLLAHPRRGARLTVGPDPQSWLATALAKPGVRRVELSPTAALAASFLPEPFHADPADRLLVATARELDVAIVTGDRKILDYARLGHVQALAC